jgi:hypothetical protein
VVFENVKQGAIYNEAKRQAALRWLSERARLRDRRETRTAQLAWWAFFMAIAAMSRIAAACTRGRTANGSGNLRQIKVITPHLDYGPAYDSHPHMLRRFARALFRWGAGAGPILGQ